MTLDSLKLRAWLILLAAMFSTGCIMVFSQGEAVGLATLFSAVAGIALLVWLAAIVADAAVHSLKKEN